MRNYDVIGYISIGISMVCLLLMRKVRITQSAVTD
jgi:hypothetical protein